MHRSLSGSARAAIGLLIVMLAGCSGSNDALIERPLGAPSGSATAPSGNDDLPSVNGTATPDEDRPIETQAPVPAGTAPAEGGGRGPGVIGYVGCSVTRDAVVGYEAVGGQRIWPVSGSYGGASVGNWIDKAHLDIKIWREFEDRLAANPDTRGLWFELCTGGSPEDNHENTVLMLEELRRRAPGVEAIWVSAQPRYVDVDCDVAGDGGPERMAQIAEQVAAEGLALPGPVMGPLTSALTSDGCHANGDGRDVMGRQLLDFFGAEGTDGARGVAGSRQRPS